MARIPLVERAYGQDELARRHRWSASRRSTCMLAAHRADHPRLRGHGTGRASAPPSSTSSLDYPGMLLAVAGTVAAGHGRRHLGARRPAAGCATSPGTCCTSTPTSASGWRCRTSSGPAPTSSPRRSPRVYWWGLYAAALAACWSSGSACRSAAPCGTGCVVTRGRSESAGVVSVHRRRPAPAPAAGAGRPVLPLALPRRAGLVPRQPYSLSARPARPQRCGSPSRTSATAAARSPTLRPGTRVLVEGPYGRLHRRRAHPAQGDRCSASGIGITPLRALLEELTSEPGDVALIYRARSDDDVVLRTSSTRWPSARGARLFYRHVGLARAATAQSWLPADAAHLSDVEGAAPPGARHRPARRLPVRQPGPGWARPSAPPSTPGCPGARPPRALRLLTRRPLTAPPADRPPRPPTKEHRCDVSSLCCCRPSPSWCCSSATTPAPTAGRRPSSRPPAAAPRPAPPRHAHPSATTPAPAGADPARDDGAGDDGGTVTTPSPAPPRPGSTPSPAPARPRGEDLHR